MTTVIAIDGGLGRVISSIPALLKYEKNHKNEEWYIMINFWNFVTWGFPELQNRTFDPEMRGSSEIFLKADRVISAEPYRVPKYYKNEISLREAFDVVINDTDDHSDLPPMQFVLSQQEKRKAFEIISEAKMRFGKQKTIVIQPYGSTAQLHDQGIYDDSLRSIPKNMLDYLVDNLSKDYNLIFMGAKEFHDNKTFKPSPDPSMREWASIIAEADYFVGCDSCGQHMKACFDDKASVILAGTHKNSVSYKDKFHIIERDVPFYPDFMRISNFESHLNNRLNHPRIEFTQEEIVNAYQEIVKNIEGNDTLVRDEVDTSTNVIEVKPSKKCYSVNYN